jgi:hypothetical protein
MPVLPFEALPDDARLWVFAAAADVDAEDAPKLLHNVDLFLASWAAHGHPLTSARQWRDDRFLAVAVDQRTEGASGCSIDGLFRTLQALEKVVGTSLLTSGLVHFRDSIGLVHSMTRDDFVRLARQGGVDAESHVFDTTVTTAGEYRTRFERKAGESWHAQLLAG